MMLSTKDGDGSCFNRKRGIRGKILWRVMQPIFDVSEWMCKFGSTWPYDLCWEIGILFRSADPSHTPKHILYSARNEPTHRRHQRQDRLYPSSIALGSPRSQELVHSSRLPLSSIGRGIFICACWAGTKGMRVMSIRSSPPGAPWWARVSPTKVYGEASKGWWCKEEG